MIASRVLGVRGWDVSFYDFISSFTYSYNALKICSFHMTTSSNRSIFRVTGPSCGEFTGHRWIPPHKGQWRGALVFLPEASFGLRVLSSPASVCLSVCLCVCINHLLVRTITHQPFTLESPNLDERRKTPWLRCLLFLGVIDLDLQGQM